MAPLQAYAIPPQAEASVQSAREQEYFEGHPITNEQAFIPSVQQQNTAVDPGVSEDGLNHGMT